MMFAQPKLIESVLVYQLSEQLNNWYDSYILFKTIPDLHKYKY